MRNTEGEITGLMTEDGVAFLTVMLVLLMLTVLGVGAMTITGLENRVAGILRTVEAGATAAESCIGTSVNVIQQTIDNAGVPAGLSPNPVPTANAAVLNQEIMGQLDNNADEPFGVPTPAPNITLPVVNTYSVNGDIDRLYAKAKAGGSLQFANAAGGTGQAASVDIFYRVNCVANNVAVGTISRKTAVYACTATGETCQRRPY